MEDVLSFYVFLKIEYPLQDKVFWTTLAVNLDFPIIEWNAREIRLENPLREKHEDLSNT